MARKIDREKYFESAKFLKAENVRAGTKFTILTFEEIKTRLGIRPILRLKESDLPFGLNATNFDKMVEKFGDDADKWKGKKITLVHEANVNNPSTGKSGPALRIA